VLAWNVEETAAVSVDLGAVVGAEAVVGQRTGLTRMSFFPLPWRRVILTLVVVLRSQLSGEDEQQLLMKDKSHEISKAD
jgi:hypothetical protein